MNVKADAFMHQQFLAKDPSCSLDQIWTTAAVSFNIAVPSHDEALCVTP